MSFDKLLLLAAASLTLGAGAAAAAPAAGAPGPVQPGTEIKVDFVMTVVAKVEFVGGTATRKTSTLNHVMKGRCKIVAGMPGDWGLGTPTPEQKRAYEKEKAAKPPATSQEAFRRKMDACKGNQSCMVALIQQMSKNGGMESVVKPQGRFQVWSPESCSGTLTADDTHSVYEFDPGMTQTYTMTVKGAAAVLKPDESNWNFISFEVQHEKNETVHHFRTAPRIMIDRTTIYTSPVAKTIKDKAPVEFLHVTFPDRLGPTKGGVQDGAYTRDVKGGKLIVEWKIVR